MRGARTRGIENRTDRKPGRHGIGQVSKRNMQWKHHGRRVRTDQPSGDSDHRFVGGVRRHGDEARPRGGAAATAAATAAAGEREELQIGQKVYGDLRMRRVQQEDAEEASIPEAQAGSREERRDRGSLRGVRQNFPRWGEVEEAHDQGASEGETVPMRPLQQMLQNGRILEDPSEAAQQTIHLRHMRYIQGVGLRFKIAQEEAQRGIRDSLRDMR